MSVETRPEAGLTGLAESVHAAQAQGLLKRPEAIEQLLVGIARALTRTIEGNAADPESSWALRSPAYWDHFEMDIKEALLVAFSGLEPALCRAVREVVDATLTSLKRIHRCC